MYKYLQEHEKYIKSCLSSNDQQDWMAIWNYHKTQIEFLHVFGTMETKRYGP
jgi:hypothetical protein